MNLNSEIIEELRALKAGTVAPKPSLPKPKLAVLKLPRDLVTRLDRSRDIFLSPEMQRQRVNSANAALLRHAEEQGVKLQSNRLKWIAPSPLGKKTNRPRS